MLKKLDGLKYMNYVDRTIKEMVDEYFSIYTKPNPKRSDEKIYCKNYAICLNKQSLRYHRLETMLFKSYIKPKRKDIIAGKIDASVLKAEIKEKIHKILDNAKAETQRLIAEDQYQISSVLDTLLFKPFIRFHDLDIKELERRTQDNPIY